MTRISLSKILGWKALVMAALMIGSLTVSLSDKVASSNAPNKTKPPAPYDLSLINADPTYYKRVDARRLYQMVPIPAGQKRHEELRIIGEAIRLALPQSWLEQPLVIQAKPGRPVTFVALDSGKFPNGDTSITVKADGLGLASTLFFVTNEGRYRVLAGSPENAGPATFQVYCMSKTMRDDVRSGRYAEKHFAEVKANKKRQAAAAVELAERIRKRSSK
jgi:hypothetical protein